MGIAEKIAALQDRRIPWILLGITGLSLDMAAYNIFQNWLYMRPCEICVYIRFATTALVIAGILGAVNPGNLALKSAAYIVALYGTVKGLAHSLELIKIGKALRGSDPFGVQGCSPSPSYPFGLPLHEWFPGIFLPTGDCGVDYPIVPDGAVLSPMQKYFTDLYAEGWYLVPSWQFMKMEQCTLVAFASILSVLVVCLVSWVVVESKKRQHPGSDPAP